MFDSLDDQMKQDQNKETSKTERIVRWIAVAISSVLLFGGLYYGVRFLE
jgi:Ni,Fe-hydrogenase I cytochrome b subunit